MIFATSMSLKADVRYYVVDLGTLGGGDSVAYGINDKCQIVGGSNVNSISTLATLFDPRGTAYNIDLEAIGSVYSAATCINNAGKIVGLVVNGKEKWQATLFDAHGIENNISLGTIDGDTESYARSINNKGQIVGWTFRDRAVLFDPNGDAGKNIDLGALTGGIFSQAYAINDSNQIVGAATDASTYFRATLFDPNGTWANNRDLGTLGGKYSAAFAINNAGQIVGEARRASNENDAIATLFVLDGNNIDLGTLGGNESKALAINNKGQIVGYAENINSMLHATLFDPMGNKNNIDLNNIIAPDANWTLTTAEAINDRGWIVGSGESPAGFRAFLLIPISGDRWQFAQHWLESDCEDKAWCDGIDLNFSGKVDFVDYAMLLKLWSGSQPYREIPPCDYDRDGAVGLDDLAKFLERWLDSNCAADKNCKGTDLNHSGGVNFVDFAICGQDIGRP
jgi:probable HAF family extracellular repeat protein